MKILWVKSDFLHPTTRGGQIRTLEILRRLSARHEVHYAALREPGDDAGLARAGEYSSRAYAIDHRVPAKDSIAFAGQLAAGLLSSLPVAVARYRSPALKRLIAGLQQQERFDAAVCDFPFPAPNFPDLSSAVLFQHNVESTIWRRHAEHAATPARRAYFKLQARRMHRFEGRVCRAVRRVIAVSDSDAAAIERLYQPRHVAAIPTGVDLDFFAPPRDPQPHADLVFVGSMDWMANIDGAEWFVREILPLIRRARPEISVAIAGRKPSPEIRRLAGDPGIRVTGTVDDIRPWIWGSRVSIVPLRIGGGTRLKIYESMAARVPVVSTAVGAEGLDVTPGETILVADRPDQFAAACLSLLDDPALSRRIANAAWDRVAARYSWDSVACAFERLLQ